MSVRLYTDLSSEARNPRARGVRIEMSRAAPKRESSKSAPVSPKSGTAVRKNAKSEGSPEQEALTALWEDYKSDQNSAARDKLIVHY